MTAALILAAGLGTRLMPLTANRPKALVEVLDGCLLAGLLEACANAGLKDAVVVTGCRSEDIDKWLETTPPPLPTRTVFNAEFDTRGNAWSVYAARDALRGRDFIKLDGDLILDASILRGLLDHPAPSVAALDHKGVLDDEAMKASTAGGQVTALGKWIEPGQASGESIGVEKIAASDAPVVFEAIAAMMSDNPGGYYEDAYHALLQRGAWKLAAYDIGDDRWAEVDCAADIEHARALFGTQRQER